ncbi:MAG: RES family NAD+ phosphorylase [Saprospiraceae bacterium]|nr:RES family NAD+ phosphorylase [Saprospiraceae bacterium]
MYYHEKLEDGTVIGLHDGSQETREVPEIEYYVYHEQIAKREHPTIRGHIISGQNKGWPIQAIEHAKIRTALISNYRVHSKEHFFGGEDFPKTWEKRQAKIDASERFSPPGTIGYYFGLTVDAALDESLYYAGGRDNLEKDNSKLILAHRTFFEDILYLAPVLPAVWHHLKLPDIPVWEMFISIMNPNTSNEITDAIGIWAREFGFKGIIFPSARYGQQLEDFISSPGLDRFPILNFVEIGSHLCEQGVAIQFTLAALAGGLKGRKPEKPPAIVYSEPNLVIFDELAVAGKDRPVFYGIYNLNEAELVKERDGREGLKHQILYAYDQDEITLFVDGPKYKYLLKVPR